MTLIQTAGGETAKKTAVLSKGLQKLAVDTGTSLDQLGEGIYTIAKAGAQKWSATEQLKVMKAAAQGAKAEAVDLGTATDALSTVMLDYHAKAGKAVKYENMLIRASGLAKTSFGEFSKSLSNVVPIAAASGIS
jgi:TP901 family phage tail tape measure protein